MSDTLILSRSSLVIHRELKTFLSTSKRMTIVFLLVPIHRRVLTRPRVMSRVSKVIFPPFPFKPFLLILTNRRSKLIITRTWVIRQFAHISVFSFSTYCIRRRGLSSFIYLKGMFPWSRIVIKLRRSSTYTWNETTIMRSYLCLKVILASSRWSIISELKAFLLATKGILRLSITLSFVDTYLWLIVIEQSRTVIFFHVRGEIGRRLLRTMDGRVYTWLVGLKVGQVVIRRLVSVVRWLWFTTFLFSWCFVIVCQLWVYVESSNWHLLFYLLTNYYS